MSGWREDNFLERLAPVAKARAESDGQRASAGARAETVECSDGELLSAFAENELLGTEREKIAAHVMDCRRCGELYLRLMQFAQVSEECPEDEWEGAKKRLGNWFYGFLEEEEEKARRWAKEGARRVSEVRRARHWWELPKFEWALGFAAVIGAAVLTVAVFTPPGSVTELVRSMAGRDSSGAREAANATNEVNVPSLQEQLDAQYRPVKVGENEEATASIKSGTLLSVERRGILGVPYDGPAIAPTRYEVEGSPTDEMVVREGGAEGERSEAKELVRMIPVGGKVYPTRIVVDAAKDKVVMGILACEKCKKGDLATYVKATVVFQFPKGSLDTKVAGPVEDTIGKVLSIESREQQP